MNRPHSQLAGRRLAGLLAVLTLAPAAVNWLSLWILNDSWVAIILSAVVFYGGAYWSLTAFGLWRRIRVRPHDWRATLGWGLASAAAVAAVIVVTGNVFFQRAIPGNMLQACAGRLRESQALRYGFWQFFLFVAVILPVGEEMYWRGGLQGLLEKRFGPGKKLALSALLFTVYHCMTVSYLMPSAAGIPLVASVFIGGLLFAWMTRRTGNIWAATICHGLGAWGATIYLVWKFLR
ncbi:MAG TPA: CPBP family intramembrane glutamic endopeptidase [Candidatus Edwardsbacteria bacterium]|nr:CPBP family intramembrane glutamic endopeptidase [Candidatus Edwardsbacteria bacterium]